MHRVILTHVSSVRRKVQQQKSRDRSLMLTKIAQNVLKLFLKANYYFQTLGAVNKQSGPTIIQLPKPAAIPTPAPATPPATAPP